MQKKYYRDTLSTEKVEEEEQFDEDEDEEVVEGEECHTETEM